MKTFVGIALLCSSIMFICHNVFELYKRNTKSDVTVIQINSNWNIKNSLDLSKLNGCDVSSISCMDTDSKKRICFTNVPTIIVYHKDLIISVFGGDITLKPTVAIDSLQKLVNKLN